MSAGTIELLFTEQEIAQLQSVIQHRLAIEEGMMFMELDYKQRQARFISIQCLNALLDKVTAA